MISTINDSRCAHRTSTIVVINREKSRMLREIKKLIDRNNFLLSRKENLIFPPKLFFTSHSNFLDQIIKPTLATHSIPSLLITN